MHLKDYVHCFITEKNCTNFHNFYLITQHNNTYSEESTTHMTESERTNNYFRKKKDGEIVRGSKPFSKKQCHHQTKAKTPE